MTHRGSSGAVGLYNAVVNEHHLFLSELDASEGSWDMSCPGFASS